MCGGKLKLANEPQRNDLNKIRKQNKKHNNAEVEEKSPKQHQGQ